jgi:hypothetical protein
MSMYSYIQLDMDSLAAEERSKLQQSAFSAVKKSLNLFLASRYRQCREQDSREQNLIKIPMLGCVLELTKTLIKHI